MERKEFINRIENDIEEYQKDIHLSDVSENGKREKCIIRLDLRDQPIYQPYSGQHMLNDDIFSFIENTFKFVKKNWDLKIEILYPEEMDIKERQKIRQLIKAHYAISYKETRKKIRRTKLIAWILLIVGSLIFILYGLLEWYQVNFLFRGIIEIFSWVFIWESCDLFVFTNSSNKLELFKYLRLFDAVMEK